MSESFKTASAKPIFQEATFSKVNCFYTKVVVEQFPDFVPSESLQNPIHRFMKKRCKLPAPPVPELPPLHLSNKDSVKEPAKTLVDWTMDCLRSFSKTDIFSHTLQRCLFTTSETLGKLGDIQVDYVFTAGELVDGNSVAAVLEIKAPWALDSLFWGGGSDNPRRLDEKLAKEARAYSYQFNSPVVMFYDGQALVSLLFTEAPDLATTAPEAWVVEHGYEKRISMRRLFFFSLCQGLDIKRSDWQDA